MRRLLKLEDARCYWLIVPAFALYAAFGTPNTPEYLLPIGCALVAAGVALASVGYRWMSLVTALAIVHVIAFPVGAWVILTLTAPSPWIEPDIWPNTPEGMWAMVVGMLGLALGAVVSRMRRRVVTRPNAPFAPPAWLGLLLVSLIVPVVLAYIALGIYYHKDATGVDEYNFGNASNFGFLGYMMLLVYVGSVLQVRRYTTTHTRRDRWLAIIAVVVPMVAMLPSGSRANAFLGGALAGLAFLSWEPRPRIKWIVLTGGVVGLAILTPLMETYRIVAQNAGGLSFIQRTELALRFVGGLRDQSDAGLDVPEQSRGMLGRRLSDHHSVGFLIEHVPESFPHRGFEGVSQFPLYIVPTLLRPATTLDYNYDAYLMFDYGFRTDIGGSSPMMLIGDLYDRFSWTGILVGMALLGWLLTTFDRWAADAQIGGTIMWVLMLQGVVNMHTYSLLKVFTLFTRQWLIFMVITYAVVTVAEFSMRARPQLRPTSA